MHLRITDPVKSVLCSHEAYALVDLMLAPVYMFGKGRIVPSVLLS